MKVLPRCAQDAGCVASEAEGDSVTALPMGRIASFYYLKYTTMAFLRQHLGPGMDLKVPSHRPCIKVPQTSDPICGREVEHAVLRTP